MNNKNKPNFLLLSLYQNHVIYDPKEYFLNDLINLNYEIIIFFIQDAKIKDQTTFNSMFKVKLKKINYIEIAKFEDKKNTIGSKIRIFRKSDSDLIISENNLEHSILKLDNNGKMAICLNLNFIFNNKKYKMSMVNVNLYYNFKDKNSNSIKKEQLLKIVKHFSLITKLKNNYNIFVIGNFNFKFIKFLDNFNNSKFKKISEEIINNKDKNYLSNKYLSVVNKKDIEIGNQLFKFIKSLKDKLSPDDDKFKAKIINKFIQSIKFLGLKITCHYEEKKQDKIKLYSLLGEPLIPSSCDRILFALPKSKKYKNIIENDDIIIKKDNFNVLKNKPDYSSHRLLSLSFSLK
mgnify:CR=1 FL=1